MHPAAQTLKDIGITMASKALLTQASVKVWGVWAELKELANASHWSDWQTERNAAKFNRHLGGEDAYNPGAERSTDVEETYRVMQVLKENEAQNEAKLAQKIKRLKKSIWSTLICLNLTQLTTDKSTRMRIYHHNGKLRKESK
jgi:hypothetical protein